MPNVPTAEAVSSSIWNSTIPTLAQALVQSYSTARRRELALEAYLDATYCWICCAQDAKPDDGVAASFNLIKGWTSSYPETTGYIIPTLLAYERVRNNTGAADRAFRMAAWEVDMQMPSGAVRSGLVNWEMSPAVFNTGQVILGWTSAYVLGRDLKYAQAVESAAEWLVSVLDEDGAWRKHLSVVTSSPVQTYNTRTAWALIQAGVVFDNSNWVNAGKRNLDWALTQQTETGWFKNNGFDLKKAPLTHTICYAIEGLLEAGHILRESRFLDAAGRATASLYSRIQKDGRMRGRYDAQWNPAAYFRCLTGESQFAGILLRMSRYGLACAGYKELAATLIDGICAIQNVRYQQYASYGGVPGSHPIWAEYKRGQYVNWAAKFHLDSLLLQLFDLDPHGVCETSDCPTIRVI